MAQRDRAIHLRDPMSRPETRRTPVARPQALTAAAERREIDRPTRVPVRVDLR
jgi:hypothetical protein